MKLTVLGKYGPYPQKGGATTSYLMECCGKRILLDAGSGSLSRLQEYCSFDDLDMFILRYAALKRPIPVYLPVTPATEYDILSSCERFETKKISEDLQLVFPARDIVISFCKTLHPVECYAVKICSEGKTFVFSGDSRYSERLSVFCRGADTVLLDSGFLDEDQPPKILPHMTVSQAAETAREANAGRLLLTHVNPSYDEADLMREASVIFQNTLIVQEKEEYTI